MANPTVEREMRKLLPDACDYLVGRLVGREQDSITRLRLYAEELTETLDQFGGMLLSAVGFACTASSYLVGQEGEDRIAAALDIPIFWAARTIRENLVQSGAHRIAVISPYPEPIHKAGLAYWRAAGLEVVDDHRIDTGSNDTRSIYQLGPVAARAALIAAKNANADTILLSGTGMPTLDLIDPDGSPPIISSNYCLAQAIIAQQDTSKC